jgi:hypothetical protein
VFSFDSEVPGKVFVPAAKVIFARLLDLDTSPQALKHLKALAQIKAHVEGTTSPPDTLDATHILDTAEWLVDEKTAPWHRAVGLCLRESGHMPESRTHLEFATTLDPEYYIGYISLSSWHFVNKDPEASNEIDMHLATLLSDKLATPIDPTLEPYEQANLRGPRDELRNRLGRTYRVISSFHANAGRDVEALEWVRKACVIDDQPCGVSILIYIDLLDKTKHADGHAEALRMMHLLQAHHDRWEGSGEDALISLLYRVCVWDQREDETWWRFVAEAAKEKGELEWLVKVWEDVAARRVMHKAIFRAKVFLLCLYRDYVKDAEKASVLAAEVGVLMSTWCVAGRMDIERAKEVFGY